MKNLKAYLTFEAHNGPVWNWVWGAEKFGALKFLEFSFLFDVKVVELDPKIADRLKVAGESLELIEKRPAKGRRKAILFL